MAPVVWDLMKRAEESRRSWQGDCDLWKTNRKKPYTPKVQVLSGRTEEASHSALYGLFSEKENFLQHTSAINSNMLEPGEPKPCLRSLYSWSKGENENTSTL
jgi:hypothetical protein